MIEDKELSDLFRMECEEHMQSLDDGLLNFDQQSNNPGLLDDLFRAAHSIKGAARMLDLKEVQNLAHILEDTLDGIRKGEITVDKTLTSNLNQKLNPLRRAIEAEFEAVTIPKSLQSITSEAIDSAELKIPQPQPQPQPQAEQTIAVAKGDPASLPTEQVSNLGKAVPSSKADVSTTEMQTPSFRISTLRVDPKRLDVLLTHAGELAVTNAHIARRLPELEALSDHCEEWCRHLKATDLSVQDESFALKGLNQLLASLNQIRAGLYEDSRRLEFVSEELGNGIRTIRLLPFSTIFNQFPRLVHELAQTLHKEVDLVLEGADVVADKRVLEELKDPIMHILRNAIHHGIEEPAHRLEQGKSGRGKIIIKARQSTEHIALDIQDDGRGLELAAIKKTALKQGLYNEEQLALMSETQIQALILAPGFTTTEFITEISGRGVGLDVVRANVEKLKGNVQIISKPKQGVTFRLKLPLTLATMRVQIVGVQGCSYALPLEYIQFTRYIESADLFTMEGRQTFSLNGQPVSVMYLGDLLELKNISSNKSTKLYTTFLKVDNELFGLVVDELLDETEIMLKAQSQLLKRVRNISATTILVSGEICPVLNVIDLLKSLHKLYLHGNSSMSVQSSDSDIADDNKQKTLLLVEDSITTRTQEKRILESAGYKVVIAVDGLDGYNKFQSMQFDGIVSDVEMPNMTGFALTEAIRKDTQHADIPIILVTSLSSEADQHRGLNAGANAYLVKSAFDQQKLLDCLTRLV